jgi:hypothetical protein
MSEVSKLTVPYLTRAWTTATGDNEVRHTELKRNQAFRTLDDEYLGPTLYFTPTCNKTPTLKKASQLDIQSGGGRFWISDGTVFTLVTEKGPETLVAPFHFVTNANNEVIFPEPDAPSIYLEAQSCDLDSQFCKVNRPVPSSQGGEQTLV